MNNLAAVVLSARASSPRPRRLHKKALEIRQRVLGEEHPSTLVTLNNLGEAYLRGGPLRRGRAIVFSKALDHPSTRARR